MELFCSQERVGLANVRLIGALECVPAILRVSGSKYFRERGSDNILRTPYVGQGQEEEGDALPSHVIGSGSEGNRQSKAGKATRAILHLRPPIPLFIRFFPFCLCPSSVSLH